MRLLYSRYKLRAILLFLASFQEKYSALMNLVKRNITLVLFRIKFWIGRYDVLFFKIYSTISPELRCHFAAPHKAIVIEGYPRSANTFSSLAFKHSNPGKIIASHLHSQAQIIRGVKLNIPVLMLIREPEQAIRSVLVRRPELSARAAIFAYIRFYEDTVPYIPFIVVATMQEATTDFGEIIRRINAKYGTTFCEPIDDMKFRDRIFSEISFRNKSQLLTHSQSPNAEREELKRDIKLKEIEGELVRARKLYGTILAISTSRDC